MKEKKEFSGYPSIDRPWLKYYTESAINEQVPNMSLYEYVYKNNKDNFNGIALNYYGTKITYKKFFEYVDLIAKSFVRLGVKENDVVSIVALSSIPSVLMLYALNRIGAIVSYINVLSTVDEFKDTFIKDESKYIVTLDLFADKVIESIENLSVNKVVWFSLSEFMPVLLKLAYKFKSNNKYGFTSCEKCISWKEFVAQDTDKIALPENNKSPDDISFYGHTGGTTGFPKTVMMSDVAINTVAKNYVTSMPHKKGEVFLCTMIPYVVYGVVVNIHMPLCLGLENVLIPKMDPLSWDKYIKKYKVNHCCTIPAYILPMLNNRKIDKMNLSKLLTVGSGGDGLNVNNEKEINSFLENHHSSAKIQKGYGMAELGATAVVEFKNSIKLGSVGIPLVDNVVCAYDSDNNKECTYYEVGEICIQSPSKMTGYKDNIEEDNKLFKTHSDGSLWVHTGDLGYVDEDGFLFIVGRIKRIIMATYKANPIKVFPNVIENMLNSHEKVKESCVVGLDYNNNKVLVAYVVPDNIYNNESLIKELTLFCSQNIADNMRPKFYEIIESLPLTSAGKVDFRTLELNAKKLAD